MRRAGGPLCRLGREFEAVSSCWNEIFFSHSGAASVLKGETRPWSGPRFVQNGQQIRGKRGLTITDDWDMIMNNHSMQNAMSGIVGPSGSAERERLVKAPRKGGPRTSPVSISAEPAKSPSRRKRLPSVIRAMSAWQSGKAVCHEFRWYHGAMASSYRELG